MGVDVALMRVEQKGTSSKGRKLHQVAVVLDSADVFAQLCAESNTPMLTRVDPYGTLSLTSTEMAQFIAELDTLLRNTRTASHRTLLTDIRSLAEDCSGDPSLVISLEGD